MNKGRVLCEQLKAIRKEVAKKLGVEYTPKECDFQGDCPGTCIQCDREGAILLLQMKQLLDKNPEALEDIRLSDEIVEALVGTDAGLYPDGELSAREFAEREEELYMPPGYVEADPEPRTKSSLNIQLRGRVLDTPVEGDNEPSENEDEELRLLGAVYRKDYCDMLFDD